MCHDGVAGVTFDLTHLPAVVRCGERNRNPIQARTTGATDAMHVVFSGFRQIVVEHMRDRFHVDAARGDIGGDQHAHIAAAQLGQRTIALRLIHVTV